MSRPEFLLKQVKVNDYFEFPQMLDLAPYTKEGVKLMENPDDDSEMPEHMYELYGVIIHSGTATGGHYYSYIRERGTDDWFEYDDDTVTRLDVEDLPDLAYGGEYIKESYDHKARRKVERRVVRSANAYVLVYDRVSPPVVAAEEEAPEAPPPSPVRSPSVPADPSGTSMPADIRRWIFSDNVSFLQDCSIHTITITPTA